MGSLQKKLVYSEVVKKQEKIMEWENVSKQITGTIAGMLTTKAYIY